MNSVFTAEKKKTKQFATIRIKLNANFDESITGQILMPSKQLCFMKLKTESFKKMKTRAIKKNCS